MGKCILCGNRMKENYKTIIEDNVEIDGGRCGVIVNYKITIPTKIMSVPTLTLPRGEYCELCSEKIVFSALKKYFKEET